MNGVVIAMDNHSSHSTEEAREIIEKEGLVTLFMPPYSPELNPIEKLWA